MDRQDFAVALLRRLNIQPTKYNVKALTGWQQAEGGHWNNTARYNPLNTTQNMPGSGDTGSQGNISVYKDWDQGVEATYRTLTNGRYGPILKALRSGTPGQIASAIDQSPWGTHGSLVYRTIGAAPAPGSLDTAPANPSAPRSSTTPPSSPASPSVDTNGMRRALIAQFVSQGGADNTSAVQALAGGLTSLSEVPGAIPATGRPKSNRLTQPGSVSDDVRAMIERANKIDARHYPYVWGGGHGKSGVPSGGIPGGTGGGIGLTGFDCSGAVAAVIGIDPRHSSQFAQWGKAGRAPGGKGVTVYANNHHVLMEINGHFFGTSRTNPRGGAGWIPRSAISQSYLAGFTARHL